MSEQLILTLCLDQDSILVSEAIMRVLGNPRYIQMGFSEDQNALLLQSCTEDGKCAWIVSDPRSDEHVYCGRSILRRICKQSGWDDGTPRRVAGTYYEQHNVVVFELANAVKTDTIIPEGEPDGLPS
jgi:hypothetical protein